MKKVNFAEVLGQTAKSKKTRMMTFMAIIEILAALVLHLSHFRTKTAWLLSLFFILFLPANIKATIEQLDYQKATFDGPGLAYLWFRIPLQIILICGWSFL